MDQSLEYIKHGYELAKVSKNKYDLTIATILIAYHYIFRGDIQKGDTYLHSGLEMSIEIGEKWMISIAKQVAGESFYLQGKYRVSLSYFEEAFEIAEKIDLKLWRRVALLGIAINRKKLGLKIDYNIVDQEIKKNYNKNLSDTQKGFTQYCYYLIFEEKKYLQSAYEAVIKISDNLIQKDKEKFLNCPWMKMIIEDWEKFH